MKRTLVVLVATAAAAVLAFVVAANLFPDWTWEVLNTARKTKAGVFGEKVPAIEATSQIQPKGPSVPDTCAVTRPSSKPFLLTPPYSNSGWLDSRMFAFGSDQLWVDLPKTGVWKGLQLNYAPTPPAYTQRVIWWRKGYDRHTEPHPNLQIKGRRLDAPAAPLMAGRAEGDRGLPSPIKRCRILQILWLPAFTFQLSAAGRLRGNT